MHGGPGRKCPPRRSWRTRRGAAGRGASSPGAMSSCRRGRRWPMHGAASSPGSGCMPSLRAHVPSRNDPAEQSNALDQLHGDAGAARRVDVRSLAASGCAGQRAVAGLHAGLGVLGVDAVAQPVRFSGRMAATGPHDGTVQVLVLTRRQAIGVVSGMNRRESTWSPNPEEAPASHRARTCVDGLLPRGQLGPAGSVDVYAVACGRSCDALGGSWA